MLNLLDFLKTNKQIYNFRNFPQSEASSLLSKEKVKPPLCE